MLIAAGAEVNLPDKSLLLVSIKQNNATLIRLLLTAHADVNVCEGSDCPITYSILRGNFELTKALIDARANVDLAPYSHPKTALRVAVERGDVNAARLLIDAKADMNHLVDNRTPLASAAEKGHLNMMKLLLETNAHVDGGNGLALSCAIHSGNAEAVRILLEAKASPEFLDCSNEPPLLIAISKGNTRIVSMLLAAKAPLVSPPDSDDPLILAVKFGNTDIMKILIDAKAPLEAAAVKSSPLLVAIENEITPAVQLLLEAKAVTDIPGTDYAEDLWFRALSCHMGLKKKNKLLRLLLDANPALALNQQSSRFMGGLYAKKHFSTLQLLLEKRAPVNDAAVYGVPILHHAVSDHMTQFVKLMIKAKADVNVCSREWNETPLIIASRQRYGNLVHMLLEAKSTLDAKDYNGYTALRHAVVHNGFHGSPVDESIVKMLVNAKAPLEFSVVSAAVRGCRSAVVKMLVDAKADLRVRDRQDEPLLLAALANKSASIIETLLTADPSLVDECDSNGMTSLMFAVLKYPAPDDASVLKMLLKHAWAYCAAQNDEEPPAKRFKRKK